MTKEYDYYEGVFKENYPNLYQEYEEVLKLQKQLFAKKMLSYGIDNIALGTDLKEQKDINLSLIGIFIRCLDKINRIKTLFRNNNQNILSDENLMDTYQDLTNYNIIAQIVLKGKWKQ
jgi:hypothetical protein